MFGRKIVLNAGESRCIQKNIPEIILWKKMFGVIAVEVKKEELKFHLMGG
jgi:hypothetical protein